MIHPSCSVDNTQLNNICSQTTSRSFCLQVLKSDPRTVSSDLNALGHISVDLALSKASSVLSHVQSLRRNAREPELKRRLETCSKYYTSAKSQLDGAKRSLSTRDYARVANGAANAMEISLGCEDEFEAGPPTVPELKQMNDEMEGLCSIVYAVVGYMG
ncbi:hypothetical protein CDL15_Pgr016582 [Punica granatum]|uniref:Pectinesterase inhibitor domain-containing protein n=1 Tax=Punica granatum TaxID=22663 RepID=A0A218XTR0_PUNGR|nr:hypothetical protein CDL15_Pgr016582 [Punica granatum]